MKSSYVELKKIFRLHYFENTNGTFTGKEFVSLHFALLGPKILGEDYENEDIRFALRQAISLDLGYNEFLVSVSRYRNKKAA